MNVNDIQRAETGRADTIIAEGKRRIADAAAANERRAAIEDQLREPGAFGYRAAFEAKDFVKGKRFLTLEDAFTALWHCEQPSAQRVVETWTVETCGSLQETRAPQTRIVCYGTGYLRDWRIPLSDFYFRRVVALVRQ